MKTPLNSLKWLIAGVICPFCLAAMLGCGNSGAGFTPNPPTPPGQPTPPTPPTPPAPQPVPAALQGNWLFTGAPLAGQFPVLSGYLNVSGSQLTISGFAGAACAPGLIDTYFVESTTLSSTGAFSINFPATGTPVATLSGQAPLSNALTTWPGSYSINYSQGACTVDASGPFTAQQIASMTTAPGAPYTLSSGSSSIAITVQQSTTPTPVTLGAQQGYYLPLQATVQFTNLPCVTSGFTTGTINGLVGDSFQMTFQFSDGSVINTSGILSDATANTIVFYQAQPAGPVSSCVAQAAAYLSGPVTLTRQ